MCHWHFSYHLPTSSCQRSFWRTTNEINHFFSVFKVQILDKEWKITLQFQMRTIPQQHQLRWNQLIIKAGGHFRGLHLKVGLEQPPRPHRGHLLPLKTILTTSASLWWNHPQNRQESKALKPWLGHLTLSIGLCHWTPAKPSPSLKVSKMEVWNHFEFLYPINSPIPIINFQRNCGNFYHKIPW